VAPDAIIRSGDYPMEKGQLDVTGYFLKSAISKRYRGYFTKTINADSGPEETAGRHY